MIDESAAVLPMWMFLSAVLGFMIGDAFGDSVRHRKCLEQANEDLRDQLSRLYACQTYRPNPDSSAAASSE
jgi:hypothetical protein